MDNTLICYHANCLDGSMAALVALDKYPDAELLPVTYGEPLLSDKFIDTNVIFVDFCPTPSQVLWLDDVVTSLTIYDHHKTAIMRFTPEWFKHHHLARTTLIFDLDLSGTGLAMKYINPDYGYGRIVETIQDRDLWRFELRYTKEVCAYLDMYTNDLKLMANEVACKSFGYLVELGTPLLQYKLTLCRAIASRALYTTKWGEKAAIVEAPPQLASEVGEVLYLKDEVDIAITYSTFLSSEAAQGYAYKVSLRSNPKGGPDVARIAEVYGGGGHKHAAGFTTSSLQALGLCN